MRTKIILSASILLAIGTLSDAVGVQNLSISDLSIAHMTKSSKTNNPETTALCFEYFIPLLNGLTQELFRSYQQCSTDARVRIDKLNDDAIKDRYKIELAADGVCVRMDACNDQENDLDYLDCISGQGNGNTKVLYVVTQNSTQKGGELREQYRIVSVDKQKCQNASERAYVEDTANTYKDLDICLRTGDVPSAVSPEISTEISTITRQEEIKTSITSEDIENTSEDSSSKILSELQRLLKKLT